MRSKRVFRSSIHSNFYKYAYTVSFPHFDSRIENIVKRIGIRNLFRFDSFLFLYFNMKECVVFALERIVAVLKITYISVRIHEGHMNIYQPEYTNINQTQAELWTLFLTTELRFTSFLKFYLSLWFLWAIWNQQPCLLQNIKGEQLGRFFFFPHSKCIYQYSFWTELPVVPAKFREKISLWVPK